MSPMMALPLRDVENVSQDLITNTHVSHTLPIRFLENVH